MPTEDQSVYPESDLGEGLPPPRARRSSTVGIVVGFVLACLCLCGAGIAGSYWFVTQNDVNAIIASIVTPTPSGDARRAAGVVQTPQPSRSPAPLGPTARATGSARPAGATAVAIREQWATASTASSEFSSPQFAARQALGQPNTPRCGDAETAWASAKKSKQEWIELSFPVPVRATKVVVYETFLPGRVVQIDLREPGGVYHTIFKGKDPTVACPGQFAPVFQQTAYLVNAVRVYIEDPAGDDYVEIDAVQLVGSEG